MYMLCTCTFIVIVHVHALYMYIYSYSTCTCSVHVYIYSYSTCTVHYSDLHCFPIRYRNIFSVKAFDQNSVFWIIILHLLGLQAEECLYSYSRSFNFNDT